MMANRKGKFKTKNGSGSYDQVMLETQLGQVVDSPIKSLERSTRYEQNDVVAEQTCKGTFLVCTTAGTTAASAPSGYSSVSEGGSVTDGTAVFTAHRFNNLANTADIAAHDALETAHPSLDFIKSLSAASDGIHYRTRNGKSDQVLDLINKLQATLSQGTVPSGNTGSLADLLSGIVHQIKALSGKSNWWETPKDSFETLSAGVVAGDVSDPNSWWVKLGGMIPIIIQGINLLPKEFPQQGKHPLTPPAFLYIQREKHPQKRTESPLKSPSNSRLPQSTPPPRNDLQSHSRR